jgi:hypothetical protein
MGENLLLYFTVKLPKKGQSRPPFARYQTAHDPEFKPDLSRLKRSLSRETPHLFDV